MKVAFVEFGSHAVAIPPDHTPVALTPAAEAALERLNREFDHPGAYLDEAVVERQGLRHFDTIEALSALLDTLFGENVPEVRARRLRPARWHFMPLKVAYDGVWLRMLEVRRTLEALKPSEALYFRPAEPPYGVADFPRSASLYVRVLDAILPQLGIESQSVDVPAEPERGYPRPSLLLRVARRIRRASQAGAPRARAGEPRILCLDFLYSVPAIAHELERLGAAPVPCPANPARAAPAVAVDDLWLAIEGDPSARGALVFDGLDLWPAFAPWLRKLVEEGIPAVVHSDAEARAIFESVRPAAVLCSVAADAREKTICHAARRAGVPTIVSRHGELGTRDVPMVAYQDVEVVDWALCWGRWEEEWTRRHAPQVGTVVVGSPMIELSTRPAPPRSDIRRRLKLPHAQRLVLYAPTAFSGNHWYASARMSRDSTYFRQQQTIVRGLLAIDGLHVVIKGHPAWEDRTFEDWCRAQAPSSKLRVLEKPGFAQLVHLADVVILDAPSTTLAEALFGSSHIVVVDHPVFRWQEGIREHLERHGIVFCTAADAARRIEKNLESGRFSGSAVYGPDAREPLVAGGPGNAARRAAEAILAIATGRSEDLRSLAG